MPTYDGNSIRRYTSTDLIAPGGAPQALWNDLAADISTAITNVNAANFVANSATARDAYWGTPGNTTTQRALQDRGAHTIRTDLGWTERYFATYNGTTNPGGASVAGWYPVAGKLPYVAARRAATQAITTTASAVTWDAIDEAFNMSWSSGQPTRLTATIAGEYEINVWASIGSTTFGSVFIRVNGSTQLLSFAAPHDSGAATVSGVQRVKLAAGDYIELMVRTNGSFNLLGVTLAGTYRRPRQ